MLAKTAAKGMDVKKAVPKDALSMEPRRIAVKEEVPNEGPKETAKAVIVGTAANRRWPKNTPKRQKARLFRA